MQQNFDREKTEMELSHEQARKELLQLHENQMSATKQDYEEKLKVLEATKTAEYEKLKS